MESIAANMICENSTLDSPDLEARAVCANASKIAPLHLGGYVLSFEVENSPDLSRMVVRPPGRAEAEDKMSMYCLM